MKMLYIMYALMLTTNKHCSAAVVQVTLTSVPRPRPIFGFGNEFLFQSHADQQLNAALAATHTGICTNVL